MNVDGRVATFFFMGAQEALLDIQGGHCVRLDRARATIDRQGWEI